MSIIKLEYAKRLARSICRLCETQNMNGITLVTIHICQRMTFKMIFQTNKTIKVSSLKSNENIQKKEGGPDCTVSNTKFSTVTLNELAMKARERILL